MTKAPRDGRESRRTTAVDVQIGRNLRKRRIELGMTQTQLAEACGITFQQVQKYENGANRVSAARLWQFVALLGLPLEAFFEGLGAPTAHTKPAVPDPERRRIDDETAKFARRLAEIKDPKLRQRLKAMLASFVDAPE
ncbi:MAG: helix-turn-helix domain-containing protein [Tagaea sp.]|nr:helix-turn-helix domain-containing protein [Tagaea sp.]